MANIDYNEQEIKRGLFLAQLKRHKTKIIAGTVAFVLLLAVIGGSWLTGHNYAKNVATTQIKNLENRINELENTPLLVDYVTPEIVQKVLYEHTADVSELVCAEYLFTNAAKFTDTSHIIGILDWLTQKSFIQQWDGAIKAGIDLTNLTIAIEGNTITITMPHAEILSYEVDYESVKVLDEKNNIFNPISVKDKNSFDEQTQEAMKARAIQNGLLVKAEENAQTIIRGFLCASVPGIGNYTIEFVVAEEITQ